MERDITGAEIAPIFSLNDYRVLVGMARKSLAPALLIGNNAGLRTGEFTTPWIAIKTGLTAPDGREEQLTEYLCDHPDCPNVATRVLGCVAELRVMAAVCEVHASQQRA